MCGGREGFGVSEAKPVEGQRWECDTGFKMKNKIIRKGGWGWGEKKSMQTKWKQEQQPNQQN